MGLIAEWNRADLTQLVDASTPQLSVGGGTPTLTVESVAERGNVLRYNGSGAGATEHCFMFSAASGLVMPSTDERRDIDVEIEIHQEVGNPSFRAMGIFFMGDLDSPAHGFAHLGQGDQERERLLNNGVVEAVTGGTSATRLQRYQIRGRKPAGAAPEVSSYMRGWNAGAGSAGEPRRSGSDSAARGAVTAFGDGSSVMGATWNGLTCDRVGLWFMSTAAPGNTDILNIRILSPFEAATVPLTYHQRLFDLGGTDDWVYYSKSTIDPTPSSGETTPNYTGAIEQHSVIAIT